MAPGISVEESRRQGESQRKNYQLDLNELCKSQKLTKRQDNIKYIMGKKWDDDLLMQQKNDFKKGTEGEI